MNEALKENSKPVRVSAINHRYLGHYATQNNIPSKDVLDKLIEKHIIPKVKKSYGIDSNGFILMQ